jgi:hypothetical protein
VAEDEVTRLRREVAALRSRLDVVESALSERVDQFESQGSRRTRDPRPPATIHDLENWVVTYFRVVLERRVSNTRRWCPEWYNHPEVVTRIKLLYYSYMESMKYDDAIGQSTWFLEHLDKHVDAMLSADGPFAACSPQRHTPARGLEIRSLSSARRRDNGRPTTSSPSTPAPLRR